MSIETEVPKSKKFNWWTYPIFLGAAVFFTYKLTTNEEFKEALLEFKNVNLVWIAWVLLASVLGHVIRALRWKQLLVSVGHSPNTFRLFLIMMTGYFVNYFIPRLGEIVKCYLLKQRENIPIPTSLGTVVAERLVDLLMLFLLVAGVMFTQFKRLSSFIGDYVKPVWVNIVEFVQDKPLIVAAIAVAIVVGFYYLNKKVDDHPDSDNMAEQFLEGVVGLIKVRRLDLFFVYTILIWVFYFLTTYLCFFAIDHNVPLGLTAGLGVLAFGSIARSLPVAGGSIGAFHFVVMEVLILYGLDGPKGLAIAVAIHGAQAIFNVVVGGVSTLWFFASNHKKIAEA